MFNIGDKIVYPMYGAGIIESIEEKDVLGEKKKYYIMRMPIENMKVMIPIDSVENFRIRKIINYDEVEDVINIFRQESKGIQDSWNKRHKINMNKIKGGDIFRVAEVVKDLMLKEEKKGLSSGEKKILENAQQILYSELILSAGITLKEVEKLIKEALFK